MLSVLTLKGFTEADSKWTKVWFCLQWINPKICELRKGYTTFMIILAVPYFKMLLLHYHKRKLKIKLPTNPFRHSRKMFLDPMFHSLNLAKQRDAFLIYVVSDILLFWNLIYYTNEITFLKCLESCFRKNKIYLDVLREWHEYLTYLSYTIQSSEKTYFLLYIFLLECTVSSCVTFAGLI